MPRPAIAVLVDLAVKVALASLLTVAVLWPGLPQFDGKAMAWRAATYPLALAIIPAAWFARFRHHRFPAVADALLGLPFLIDTAGNALDLYDRVGWWDDANHFANWGILTAGFAVITAPLKLTPAVRAGLATGFGAVTAIAWELLEYVAFIRDSPELETAYTDTLGDLGLGLLGSGLAAVAVTLALHRSRG